MTAARDNGAMRRVGLLLLLAMAARAGDEPVVQIYDVTDLVDEGGDLWLGAALSRAQAAAKGMSVEVKEKRLVVTAPQGVQEAVRKEILAVRDAFGTEVLLDVVVLKIEGRLGVGSVPVENLDALVKEKNAVMLAGPTVKVRNGQKASVSVVREVSYVGDFKVVIDDNGVVTADPVVEKVGDGIVADFHPMVAGQVVRVAAEVSVTDVGQLAESELEAPFPTPLKIQVPECTTRTVRKLIECSPAAYTVIELGPGSAALVRARVR
jgi:hypothetical protein